MTTERITLYSGPLSMFGAKVQIAALEKGIEFDLVMVPFDFHALYAPKHPQVLRINPKGQVPVLVHGDLELFDSTQIFEYFEDMQPSPPLWPRDARDRARARLLELQSDEVYFPHVVRLMGLQDHLQEPPAQAAIVAARAFHESLEAQLADGRAWLSGEFTYADIAFYMAALFGERQGATLTEATPRLRTWRDRMSDREPVRQVAGAMAAWLLAAGRPLPPFMKELLG
ncbi:glutathione S-transferase family protein [Ramlibacter tataouinensis]|uniref:glutathione S-transferase family protein n=1 Tax=Ramlibacter tataouinensis TaxID=94132 RepID=UPI0022F3EE8B|nr:glutathione S-transferase family protein [Ramlibacter tataouinensis]WBY03150.1 glutathione S-transferase family protein [Ramlibacter tataouinensis]